MKVKEKRLGMYDKSGATLVLLLMMLLTHTFAKVLNGSGDSNGSDNNSSLVVERETTVSAAPDCSVLSFDWGVENPYTYERQRDGQEPLTISPGCEETQRCLFMPDDKIFNIIAAGDAVFPVFENLLSERSPSIQEVLANAKKLYDDRSIMNIQGIGIYEGPTGIGEYRAVPQFLVDYELSEVSKFVASPKSFSSDIVLVGQEKWYHLDQTQKVNWNIRYSYNPCSVVRRREDLEFPPETAKAFSESGKVYGTVDSVCKVVMEHCTGELQQYNTTEECISFLASLPHHDPTCQGAFGEYSAMGNSFMCKYLHHFMIPFTPATHCAHAGKGVSDANGNYKCVATDCQKDSAKQLTGRIEHSSSCSEKDMEELVQGIIYSLPFCLPSLEMQVCLSNCTQAINTYLGRFAESGVVDSCDSEDVLGSSRFLSLLSVDAHLLFHLCSGDPLLATNTASSLLLDSPSIPTCAGVNQYIGTGLRCLGWDWEKVSQGMFNEWSAKYKNQRVTQSDDIATAECDVFAHLYSLYRNIHDTEILDHAANLMQSDIQIHPNGHPVILSHEQISMAFERNQSRDGLEGRTRVYSAYCAIPGKAASWMQNKPFLAIAHDTNSEAHALAREFVYSTLKGLVTKPIAPPAREGLFDERGLLDYEELLLSLTEENFRALLGETSSESDSFWTGDAIDDVRDIAKAAISWFFPESWHRAQGYITGVAYVTRRQTFGRRLKDEFIPLRETIQSLLPSFNVSASDEHLAYDALIDTISAVPIALVKLTLGIIKFVRQDPCQMMTLWNRSPERFTIEYSRLHAPVTGFATDATTPSTMGLRYQIASANRDPEIFLDPLLFNPNRADLDQVTTWNFIEGNGESSHARACPARSFSVQFAVSHAPRYFPNNITCANDMKSIMVSSYSRIIPIS